jgi:hypothetical protein
VVNAIRRIDAAWAVRVASLASLVAQQATSVVHGAPTLVLSYPAPGVSVPGDNATVVFRYAVDDAIDPLDLRSFRITVDGVDRTSHFRVTADAAWGAIAQDVEAGVRAYDVRACVCTIRGVCAELSAVVTVLSAPRVAKLEGGRKARWARVVDVTLEMLRRLLRP